VLENDLADYASALRDGDAERAVALYAGPFLDGFFVPDAGEFERWVEAERGRRSQAHARVLDSLASDSTARGDFAAAVRWCQARVGTDPLDTPATVRLLGALMSAGSQAEALRVARVHESLLREELDSAPGGEWDAVVAGLPGKVQLAELMPPQASARAQAALALAARKRGLNDWADWLRKRVELIADVGKLTEQRPVLMELWQQ